MADKQSKSFWKVFLNGLIVENPTFVLMLGMCPTLGVTTAAINGIGMGLGFTCAITILSMIREVLGSGTIFGAQVMPASYEPMAIMLKVPGGFITLGILLILVNTMRKAIAKRQEMKKEELA